MALFNSQPVRTATTFSTRLILRVALFLIVIIVTADKGYCKNGNDMVSPCPEQGSTDNADFTCPAAIGTYPHPEKCELYYSCINYRATLYSCSQFDLYDVRKNGCNMAENTDCGNRTRPPTYPPTSTPPPRFECPINVADDWFADPDDCASFYRCVCSQTYHFTCSPPTLFNDVQKECDHPRNVDCGSRPFPSKYLF